ncbi:unnamed protein product [Paramecium pentaurelia]|uniref:Uncharacterized protein n=1 Tax=Paramecium pentaurelia TaxID=43138 RepID=A0A8S1URA6_9CILI|nr:unnamed protein product [Paramecium pentaurelia]
MGKKQSENNKQQKNNGSNRKDKSRGRPPKQQIQTSNSIDTQPFDINQKQFWFTVDEAREIVRILASKCQILFKCLSGQSANNLKTQFWSSNQPQISFNIFKQKRQEFAEKVTELQTELLKKLEQYLQIKLIGEKEQMNYFFFGNNTTHDTTLTEETQDTIIQLLNPIIHEDFLGTLKELLVLTSQPENSILDLKQIDLYNINKHKHLVSWAFVIAWGKEQKIFSEEEIPSQKQDTPQNLIEQSAKIQENKEKEVLLNIDQLIQNYQEKYENEINDLIDILKQRFTNKM